VHAQAAAREADEIGERAAGVDADQHRRRAGAAR
jgi:hypothetical protein